MRVSTYQRHTAHSTQHTARSTSHTAHITPGMVIFNVSLSSSTYVVLILSGFIILYLRPTSRHRENSSWLSCKRRPWNSVLPAFFTSVEAYRPEIT